MTRKNPSNQIQMIGAISGILSIIFYFSAAVIPGLPSPIPRLLAFTFPLLWIISFMGLYDFLKHERSSAILQIALIFGIVGAAIAETFLVVQQANFIWHDAALSYASGDEAVALAKASFKGANRVQAGMDVAFDIFITLGWLLFSIEMAKSKSFNRFFAWLGTLISSALLVLNMITFPNGPAEAGLFDAGPFLGLWAFVVYVWFYIVVKKQSRIKN